MSQVLKELQHVNPYKLHRPGRELIPKVSKKRFLVIGVIRKVYCCAARYSGALLKPLTPQEFITYQSGQPEY